MTQVLTPDGWGELVSTQSAHGRTSFLVKGAGFEGWYDGLEVTADFADHPDDVIPNDENTTVLPYPSEPEGPGWDGTNSTIQPDIDPHLDMGHASDSLTGESTDEDPVEADIEGLFEPSSHLANVRPRRLHNLASDDPILDVTSIPESSPTGLENSPLNPDSVDTDDLFDGSEPHFERHEAASIYDSLVIKDEYAFMRYAADEDGDGEDDDKKHHHEQGPSLSDDDSDDDDSDSDSDSDDSSDGDSDGGDGDSGGDGGSGGHTASAPTTADFALSTTADLHFLANFCVCAENLPLHSKLEHRDLLIEAGLSVQADGNTNGVTPQSRDLEKLYERYEQDNFHWQESNLRNLVDHSEDSGDSADLYNKLAFVKQSDGYDKYIGGSDGAFYLIASGGGKLPKGEHYGHYDTYQDAHDAVEAIIARNHSRHGSAKTAAPAEAPQPTQIESQIEQLMQFWAVDNNGWWHWTGNQADLALLNQMQQQMTAVGMPQGQPGAMQTQSSVRLPNGFQIEANTPAPWREYLQTIASDRLVALAAWKDVVAKSKRLRSEGAIKWEMFKPEVATAYVQGDHGRYYTTVQRLGSYEGAGRQLTTAQVSGWSCECEWGQWAWLRKRSFVGRMCSHAYALFSEAQSLDWKARLDKGKPGRFASVSKTAWVRNGDSFEWVTDEPAYPTASITRTASGYVARVWSDGLAEDSFNLGSFGHSEQARRAIARLIAAHLKLSAEGDVDMVGGNDAGTFQPYAAPDSISGGGYDPYSADGAPEDLLAQERQEGSPGIQESTTRVGFSVFAEHDDGDDDEGPEESSNGIEEADPDDEESLDEEVAEDEADADGSDEDDDEDEPVSTDEDSDDGGHEEPHRRDEDDDEGTDNPGDDSDDEGIEKNSSVAELQKQYGLSHLAGAQYSLAQQQALVSEGEGKTARNRGDLDLTGTHYEAAVDQSAEDTLAFLF